LILEYDTIILGSCLNAFLLATQKFCPVIFSDFEKPFRFDYLEPGITLQYLKMPQSLEQKSLTTHTGQIEVGMPKDILWERLMFMLSAAGHVPLSNLCRNIRISDNKVVCSNEYSKIAEIHFNECIYFGDNNVSLPIEQKGVANAEYICYDWIAFNKGGKHEIDFIHTDDKFVNEVWFYPSDRIDGNTSVRDACVVSTLDSEQLADFNFSETMARFKLIHEMESRGMKGLFNGYGQNGKPKHYKFKTTHIRRDRKNKQILPCVEVGGVKNAVYDEKELYEGLSQSYMAYDRFLRGIVEQ
jgi:hypothetical protein